MGAPEPLQVLARFNEKVARLERLSLSDEAQTGAIVEWRRGLGWDGIHVGPGNEQVEASILSLRFFLQNNEATSLSNMAQLYPQLGTDPQLVGEFLRVRSELNAYLDTPTPLAISTDRTLSQRDILDIFLWGDLAHANPKHEATFKALSGTPFFPLFQAVFIATVRGFIGRLRQMRDINVRVLARAGVHT